MMGSYYTNDLYRVHTERIHVRRYRGRSCMGIRLFDTYHYLMTCRRSICTGLCAKFPNSFCLGWALICAYMAHVQAKSFILALLPSSRAYTRVYSGVYASVPILFLGVCFWFPMTLVGPLGCMMLC